MSVCTTLGFALSWPRTIEMTKSLRPTRRSLAWTKLFIQSIRFTRVTAAWVSMSLRILDSLFCILWSPIRQASDWCRPSTFFSSALCGTHDRVEVHFMSSNLKKMFRRTRVKNFHCTEETSAIMLVNDTHVLDLCKLMGDNNYITWSFTLEQILRGKELWIYITTPPNNNMIE